MFAGIAVLFFLTCAVSSLFGCRNRNPKVPKKQQPAPKKLKSKPRIIENYSNKRTTEFTFEDSAEDQPFAPQGQGPNRAKSPMARRKPWRNTEESSQKSRSVNEEEVYAPESRPAKNASYICIGEIAKKVLPQSGSSGQNNDDSLASQAHSAEKTNTNYENLPGTEKPKGDEYEQIPNGVFVASPENKVFRLPPKENTITEEDQSKSYQRPLKLSVTVPRQEVDLQSQRSTQVNVFK